MTWKCSECGRVTSQPDTAEQVWCRNFNEHNRRKARLMQPIEEDDE